MRDDPDLCCGCHPRPEPVDDRGVALRLRGPDLLARRSSRRAWWTRPSQELDYVVDHGARVILMRPAPAWGYRGPRSFALPEFDPYWARVEEAGAARCPPRVRHRVRPLHERVGGVRAPRARPSPKPQPFSSGGRQLAPRHRGCRHVTDRPRHPAAPSRLRFALDRERRPAGCPISSTVSTSPTTRSRRIRGAAVGRPSSGTSGCTRSTRRIPVSWSSCSGADHVDLRIGLPARRGTGRPAVLRRRAASACPTRTFGRSWAAT